MSKLYTTKDLEDDFTITIQFTTKDGRTDMSLTTNDGDAPDIYNMKMHGISLAENNNQLEAKDHDGLQAFCKAYLEQCGYYVR